jgi:hypothetical protein
MTIKLFVPSYNRPAQLYALLESIIKYDEIGIIKEILVCYQGTDYYFEEGYKEVKKHFKNVTWVKKSGSHYKDVMNSLEGDSPFWGVSTDDSVFYRPFDLTNEELEQVFTNDVNYLSFRLGYNTTTIDYSNPDEKHFLSGSKTGKLVKFYWTNHVGHYGHPFALDSFVTRTEHMKTLMIKACSPAAFDYRAMECKMSDYLRMNPNKPFALCFDKSVLVNVPSNKVCDGPYLKNGVIHPFSTEELNYKFLAGEKIDIEDIINHNIDNVQMELAFKFIPR